MENTEHPFTISIIKKKKKTRIHQTFSLEGDSTLEKNLKLSKTKEKI